MKFTVPCAAALALLPLVSAYPAPTAAPGSLDILKYGRDVAARAIIIGPGDTTTPADPPDNKTTSKSDKESSSTSSTTSSSSSESSTSTATTSSSASNNNNQPNRDSTTSPPPLPTQKTPTGSSTSVTKIESTGADGEIVTLTVSTVVPPDPTNNQENSNAPPPDDPPSGISTSTVIGLSVAGGLAALGIVAFIVWKFTNKRFSGFDNDDGAAINWPDLQKEPEVIASRPAPSVMGTNATNSTIDLSKDPYAVPPMPQNSGPPYRDDASSGYYDPYRGPVPQAFHTPPASSDGHHGEAIPMSTYGSGRASPGPNLAYNDPYAGAMRSTSPGPNLAYGDPMQRTGTPVQRMGTPAGGGAATFQEIARSGTPGAAPFRTGTPGYGQQPAGYDPYGRRSPGPGLAYGR